MRARGVLLFFWGTTLAGGVGEGYRFVLLASLFVVDNLRFEVCINRSIKSN